MAEKKLLAALPERDRTLLEKAEHMLGFEKFPHVILSGSRGISFFMQGSSARRQLSR